MQPEGQVLIVEPPFHVSKAGFAEMIKKAVNAGLNLEDGPKGIFNKTLVLKKS